MSELDDLVALARTDAWKLAHELEAWLKANLQQLHNSNNIVNISQGLTGCARELERKIAYAEGLERARNNSVTTSKIAAIRASKVGKYTN